MPIVTVEMWKGRTVEQKKAMIAGITDALVNSINCTSESVSIVIHEVDKENWGKNGQMVSELK